MGVILSKTPYTSDEIQIQGIMDLLDMYLRCVEVSGRSPATIDFYTKKLLPWACWLEDRQIYSMNQINAEVVRNYLAYLQLTHNPGGGSWCLSFDTLFPPVVRVRNGRQDGNT
jgi:hypothetical protein